MDIKIYYDTDSDFSEIQDLTIAVIGYGSQGHAHAQNLRDSGLNVIVGQRPGSINYDLAVKHGFKPVSAAEAAEKSQIIMMLVPDQLQARIYHEEILPHLTEGKMLLFSHGFNIHFGQIVPPKFVDVAMVAPKGPGHLVRREYERGAGVPCLVAIHQDSSGKTLAKALGYAKGIGGARGGVLETTFKEETETDLFGEQCVLCGGVSELIKAGFETLVNAGYRPEIAYFECCHELKLIVDLIYEGGLSRMRYSISDTAEYGDLTRGKRIITDETRWAMQEILKEIQTGEFAREWILENIANKPVLNARRNEEKAHQIEEVGSKLRGMMGWLKK